MESLPNEVRLLILEHLPLQDVCSMEVVSNRWAECAAVVRSKICEEQIVLTTAQVIQILNERKRVDLNYPARYEAVTLTSLDFDVMNRFFGPYGCYLYRLTIERTHLLFYNFTDTLTKLDNLQHLKLKNNVWMPETSVLIRNPTASKRPITTISLHDNRKKRGTISSQDFSRLLHIFSSVDIVTVEGRMLDFPSQPYRDYSIWNIRDLKLSGVEISHFKILTKNVASLPNGKLLEMVCTKPFFEGCALDILSLVGNGIWEKLIFHFDEEDFFAQIALPVNGIVISNTVTTIKNTAFLFEEDTMLAFPNLQYFETYVGSSHSSENEVKTSVTHLKVTEMTFSLSAQFARSTSFKNVAELTLSEVSSYCYVLPHIFANMIQLVVLKIMGKLQRHWVEDFELIGCSSASKQIVVKSDGWGILEEISNFKAAEDTDNFGIRYLKNLKKLAFDNTDYVLTDFAVVYGVCELHQLEECIMPNSRITDFGLTAMKMLINLKVVNLSNCDLITQELCQSMMENNANLLVTYE